MTFGAIRIKLAAPQKIRDWSHGEVKKRRPSTTGRSSPSGTVCSAPHLRADKDYECACGKYKRMKFAGVICDKCGVEVTRAGCAASAWGHRARLACSHVWFFKGLPSRIGQLLDMSLRELEKILYFRGVRGPRSRQGAGTQEEGSRRGGQDPQAAGRARPRRLHGRHGCRGHSRAAARHGHGRARAELRSGMGVETSAQKRKKIVKRLKVVEAFLKSATSPSG